MSDDYDLTGWNIGRAAEAEWQPWGSRGDARAKVLATGDGYLIALVEAQPGYTGDPHVHTHAEFSFLIDGSYRTQGQEMEAGDAYVAEPGSVHSDFASAQGATYLSIFKL